MSFTHGENAVARLVNTFRQSIPSTSVQDELTERLNSLPAKAVYLAVGDMLGETRFVRDKFQVGKFPTPDELLPRVNFHVAHSLLPGDKPQRLPPPKVKLSEFTPYDINLAKRAEKFKGRPVIDQKVTLEAFNAGGKSGKYPPGSGWCYDTRNVYGARQ